jgi:hypothetical protein
VDLPKQKTMYLGYILSFVDYHVKSDLICNQLLFQVNYVNKLQHFDVIEDLSSIMQHGCPWMQKEHALLF